MSAAEGFAAGKQRDLKTNPQEGLLADSSQWGTRRSISGFSSPTPGTKVTSINKNLKHLWENEVYSPGNTLWQFMVPNSNSMLSAV